MMAMNRHRGVVIATHSCNGADIGEKKQNGEAATDDGDNGRTSERQHRWCRLSRRRAYAAMTSAPVVAVVTCLVTLAVCSSRVAQPRTQARTVVTGPGGMAESGHATNTRPVLFVGGCPRSGTTLLRVILDSHPDVFCGEETRVIPDLLAMIRKWRTKGREKERQFAGGVTEQVVDGATRDFIWSVLLRHGEKTPPSSNLLCAKDPLTLRHAVYLASLFPTSRFLLMLRDGRAVANSIVRRKIRITNVNSSSYADTLAFWQLVTSRMLDQCTQLGSDRCMVVRYEDLVSETEKTIGHVLAFLGLPWSPNLLKHEELVAAGDVRISRWEPSSSQVSQSIYTSAIDAWQRYLPGDVLQRSAAIAPLLQELGYTTA